MTMKTIISSILMYFLLIGSVFAQQEPQFNQYVFNNLIINPAYAGTKGQKSFNATFAKQWLDFKGSPATQTLSYETPVWERTGLGLHIINDKIGAQTQQALFGSYSHRLPINNQLTLSLGLAFGFSNYTLDGSKIIIQNENDPAIPKTSVNKLQFDSKTGFFLFSEKFYTGFSVSSLLADVFDTDDMEVPAQVRHYYLTMGYLFELNDKIKFKPSILLKEDFKATTNVDLTALFLFNDIVWLGGSLRTGTKNMTEKNLIPDLRKRNSVALMIEWNVKELYRIGYSYTATISALSDYTGHEIHLGYIIPDKKTQVMKTPRYF